MGWYPCPSCCGSGGCVIDDGWECDVKNGIVSSDVTGHTINSGTWNATQSWESGSTADALETSSGNAKITCDTAQSGPLDGRVSVTHYVKVTDAADEAVIWLNGITVTLTSASVAISGGGATAVDIDYGIGLSSESYVKVCTWYDSDTGLEYIGVHFYNGSGAYGKLQTVATLAADGTTSFGTADVTGTVSFHHKNGNSIRGGHFRHNTTLTDSTNCITCNIHECEHCPGGNMPRYLSVAISGMTSPPYGGCSNCEDLNGTYVREMAYLSYWCNDSNGTKYYICRNYPYNTLLYDYYVTFTTRVTALLGGSWKLTVVLTEWRIGTWGGLASGTATATYSKTYTSSDLCTAIDDDLTLESSHTGIGASDCQSLNALTIHVTASE